MAGRIEKERDMVKRAEKEDLRAAAELAVMMWDSHSAGELAEEFAVTADSGQAQFFLKYVRDVPVGFAQCQLRHDYVEGTESSPVGYLEGIFVKEGYRKQGYAKELLAACEQWAREQGCTEFASDCELDNTGSLAFHLSMGFEEANRVICFTKKLHSIGREDCE